MKPFRRELTAGLDQKNLFCSLLLRSPEGHSTSNSEAAQCIATHPASLLHLDLKLCLWASWTCWAWWNQPEEKLYGSLEYHHKADNCSMKPACISPCKLACFPSQHHFNEKLQRKAPHLRASGSIYEFGPEGRVEENFLFPFYHSHSLDGSRNLPFSGICMKVLSELASVYVAFDGARRALRATRIQFPHNSPLYPVIGEAITKTSRRHVWLLL